jgi:hypothetical protein
MNKVVADTDVVSYVFKNHPFGSGYDSELAGRIILISFMTWPRSRDGCFNTGGATGGLTGCARSLIAAMQALSLASQEGGSVEKRLLAGNL